MKTKLTFPGLKELLLPLRPDTGSADNAALRARALFQPPEGAMTQRHRSLVDFLRQVSLFEDLGRRELVHVARIIHEREYADGEYMCEEGRPAAALFVVRRGVVEVVRRGADAQEVPLALLEPPASFEEAAAIGAGVIRWFSVRARGPVSLLALGKSDLDALILNFPVVANKVLIRLAEIMAIRLQMLIDAEGLEGIHKASGAHAVTRATSATTPGVVLKVVVTAAAVVLAAYLVWALRSLIVPACVGGLLAYICRPLVTRLERYWIPRGLAVALLLLMFASVALGIVNSVRAVMPSETGALELRVRALYALNRHYQTLMGLDPSWTRGNRLYQLAHRELDPLMDRVSEVARPYTR